MKYILIACLAFVLCGAVSADDAYGIRKGMTPQEVDEILGQPEYQFVRGYFYDSERGFYWDKNGEWIWVGFYDYESEPDDFRVYEYNHTKKPQINKPFEPSTCGVQVVLPIARGWLPFPISKYKLGDWNFPKEYEQYISAITTGNKYMSNKAEREEL